MTNRTRKIVMRVPVTPEERELIRQLFNIFKRCESRLCGSSNASIKNAAIEKMLQKAESYIVHLKEQHRQHLLETTSSQ